MNIIDKVSSCLNLINENKHLNAFVNIYAEEAKKQAKVTQNKSVKKLLNGMVIGLKDLICYENHPITAGSKILEGFISQISATAVQRTIDNEGIIIGHQNCDEFGMGSSNENSCYGPVLHPIDNTKVPGGSSGGSATAVYKNMCCAALATDTGGSIRQPASFCGIIGFKPTYSRVSRYGLVAYSSSFDTVGILSKTVLDCAKVLYTIAGADEKDNTCSKKEIPLYHKSLNWNSKAKIACFKETLDNEVLNPEIKKSILKTLDLLKKQGHNVEIIDFPLINYTLPIYYILTTAEASANLAKYDGIRYGYRSANAKDLQSLYINTRSEGFGDEVKRRILLGTSILSEGYFDSYYGNAQKARKKVINFFDELFKTYDFLITPTTPTTAFNINSKKDPIEMYLSDMFTVPASIAGIPAISIPNGVGSKGLPIGIQIMANNFEEAKLLSFADFLSNKTGSA